MLQQIVFHHPPRLVFGLNCTEQFADDFIKQDYKRLFILSIPPLKQRISLLADRFRQAGISVMVDDSIAQEPTFADFENILEKARMLGADSVAGIGGGSVMDVAKLLAAWLDRDEPVRNAVGNGLVPGRNAYLALLPSTSGTGSEVSPNAIFLDELDGGKKGIISPYLVPDAAYVDPALTFDVPAAVTAATGLDALTHCLEAYTNRFAHPMVDVLALEGIRLISHNLQQACLNGQDAEARAAVSLGSLYGGMCLGPVNTAAVHALAYPLGSTFKIPHGLSNALLLPYVMEFNLPAATAKFAAIARTMGATEGKNDEETALAGIQIIKDLIRSCGMVSRLSEIGIQESDIPALAEGALKVQRLLNNNPREVTYEDAISIYKNAI